MVPLLFQLGNPPASISAGYRGLLAFWAGGAANAGAVPPQRAEPFRGTGGWGAGLNARRITRHTRPIPLSEVNRKLSDLDEIPPKPVIVKPTPTTPATVLAPLIQEEPDYEGILQALIFLDEQGMLD